MGASLTESGMDDEITRVWHRIRGAYPDNPSLAKEAMEADLCLLYEVHGRAWAAIERLLELYQQKLLTLDRGRG